MYDGQKSKLLEMIFSQARLNKKLIQRIQKLEEENEFLRNEIELRGKDSLTGLYNRTISSEAYLKAKTVIMCDIDDFKKLNDTYGHNFGDSILKKISEILSNSVRSSDYVVRWGGEEFVLFIDHPHIEVAQALAERIRIRVESLEGELLEDGNVCPCITMSFGVSKLHNGDSLTGDIEKADKALYDSKKKGKNVVTVFGNEEYKKGNSLVKRK